MRIGFKLVLGFVVLSIIAAGLGLWIDRTNRAVRDDVDSLARNSIVDFADATEMQLALMASHATAAELLEARRKGSASSAPHVAVIRQRLREFRRTFARTQQKRAQALHDVANQARGIEMSDRGTVSVVDPLLAAFREHSQALERFLQAANQDNEQAAEILYGELTPHLQREILPLLESFKQSAEHQFAAGVRSVEESLTTASRRGRVSTAVSLTASILLGIVFSQLIGKPLSKLTATTRELGTGNLSARSDVRLKDEIGALAAAINQMASQLQSTMVSKAEVDNILQSMREMLLVTDENGTIVKMNRSAGQMLGYRPDDLQGRHWTALFGGAHSNGAGVPLGSAEQMLTASSGELLPVHCSGAALQRTDGSTAGYVLVALDISERKRSEAALQKSLAEKEVLLRELHHRVKNNLQIISSLLRLQGRETDDPRAARLFSESEGRVRSMSLIHEQLYQSPDLTEVDFREYLTRLATHLSATADHVRIQVEAEPIRLAIGQAVPCGMIVNELVSNAIEHAFPGLSGGTITVKAEIVGRRCNVSVTDDGIGMSAAATQAHPALGLQIVQALIAQLQAHFTVDNKQGTSIALSFDVERPAKHVAALDT